MVGVPGRSKGCHTCKKRRVKCDEQKPECKRCLKAGYKCAGYARDLEFRVTTPSSHAYSGNFTASSSTISTPAPEYPPPEISLVAWKPDMQYSFLFGNFVWSSYGSPWLQLTAQGKLGVLAQQACSSLSMVTFGRYHQQKEIELTGTVQYGLAVSKVRRGLADPSNPSLSELLVPILILLIYSSSAPQSGESQAHVMGLFRLISTCGPEAFQNRPLRHAFSSCRATLVIVGLLQKRKLFLEEQKWRTIPWALQPEIKSNQDQLVDLLTKMPRFLEEQQALRTRFDPERHRQLLGAASSQLRLLFQWRRDWEISNPRAVSEAERPGLLSDSYLPIPAVANRMLRFSCFTTAVEIALYNAVLLCYLGLLYFELGSPQAEVTVQHIAIAAMSTSTSWSWSNVALELPSVSPITLRAAAIEIVRSFEYQLLHIQQCPSTPTLFWLFPLGLASKVLSEDYAMSRWIQQMLDTSAVTRGYGRGENAFGFGFYELPQVDERPNDSYTNVRVA